MAQSPDKPKDNGKVGLPKISPSMNKLPPPPATKGGKGGRKDKENIQLGAEDDKKAEQQKLLARVRKRFDRCVAAESDNRAAALDDLKFKAGDQWPQDVAAQRNFDKRPCLTINKIPTFVSQITNDLRQNRPGINVNPVGDRGDVEVAKMYRGLIRAIERDSHADIAYDTAADGAVSNGFGYIRLNTEYESPTDMDQVIVVERIRNPFTVYLDPDRQMPDGSDAKYGFVTNRIPRTEFEEEYPDAQLIPFLQSGVGENYKNWVDTDSIRVAEYFEVGHTMRTLVQLSNGYVGWEDELSDEILEAISEGMIEITNERESTERKVHWYKLTAVEVLEEKDTVWGWVPLIEFIGNEIDIEGKIRKSGIIRDAKEPQRMYNYWRCLSLDTALPTPSGWTTMGAVKAGDELLDEAGRPCTVMGTSPINLHHDCYKVEFDDGSHIVADADHLWTVEERGRRKAATWEWSDRTIRTVDLTPDCHFIWAAKPLQLDRADLPIDPYLLGVWLGDGSSAEPMLSAGDDDIEEMRGLISALGYIVGEPRYYGDKVGVFTVHSVRRKFSELKLLGNKHIPSAYLRGSKEQRWALLQGLMDTDGSVSARGQCSFTTTNDVLAGGFAELLRSVGIKAVSCRRESYRQVMPNGREYTCSESVQFAFSAPGETVFRLARKQAGMVGRKAHPRRTKRHSIVRVTPIASVPVKCVKVDSPSHLFLAGPGMVPTHNTAETELVALAPKAPWVIEEGQLEGHESEWKQANTKSFPYLAYKATSVAGKQAPPPQRQGFAQIPAGVVNAVQGAAQDMMAVTGIRFDATQNERMIDESGKAIRELRRSGDLGSFHYADNMARSLRHVGRMMIDAIPKVYDTKRVVTILREDDSEERVQIDPDASKPFQEVRPAPTPQQPAPKTLKIFNPTYGQYGVTVTIGPSYATKRIEASENMMAFVKALPNTASMVADLIAAEQDWPGAEKIAARLAKAVPPNLLTPEQKDIPPQVQALMQAMDGQIKQLSMERQQLIKQLMDTQADRNVQLDKIQKDFEAKLLKIVADVETKSAATTEKAQGNVLTHIHAITELGQKAVELVHKIEQSNKPEAVAAE